VTTAAIILAAVLAVAAVLWVARPFLRPTDEGEEGPSVGDAAGEQRLRLLEERDRALGALKELEFDHRTGKISDADYRELVGPLRHEAAEAIAALEAGAAGRALARPQAQPQAPDDHLVAPREREEQPR
jgi:hypothetical protein